MNTSYLQPRFSLPALAAVVAVFAAFTILPAHAINVAEGADFPNTTPGPATTLTEGVNVFSGTLTTPGDTQDRFNVTVPSGFRMTQASKDFPAQGILQSPNVSFNTEDRSGPGTATFTSGYPLGPGTYSAIISAGLADNNPWSVTFTIGPAPNYAVSTTSGFISVTDNTGNSDTLNVTNPVAGFIRFAASGRTFSVNGGPLITNDSGNISLAGVADVSVSCGNGNDVVNVSGFSGGTFPGLYINGGAGNDTVNFNGDITFAAGNDLDVELQSGAPNANSVNVAANANLITSGNGTIDVRCSRNVAMASGSSFEVQDGDLTVEANQQSTNSTGNFVGVNLDGGTLKSTGAGYVTVKGTGGDGAGSVNGYQIGVQIINGAKVTGGTTGYVIVNGTGGASSNIVNRGISVEGGGSSISSGGGPVFVTGNGGPVGTGFGIGVSVLNGGEIRAGGASALTITATGAGGPGGGENRGLEIGGGNARIASGGGNIGITGTGGPNGSFGLIFADDGSVTTPASGGNIVFHADTVSIAGAASIATTNPASVVQFAPNTFNTVLRLGGADVAGDPATLGLTDAELDRVQTAGLIIGSGGGSGYISLDAPISHATATNINLLPGSGGVLPFNVGTNFALSGSVTIPFGTLKNLILGPSAGLYTVLTVAGTVNLTGTSLQAVTFYTGQVGDTFTIVDNDGTDPIVGNFSGLPEGAYYSWPGTPTLKARVSYIGGTGNDVTLTLVSAQPALTGTGSLTNGNWRFTGTGLPTNIHTIQATTNFITWTNIGTATGNVSGVFSFIDTNAFRFPHRFYRTTN